MKPEQAPSVPENTPWKRLDNAVKKVLSISKEDVVEMEDRARNTRTQKPSNAKSKR